MRPWRTWALSLLVGAALGAFAAVAAHRQQAAAALAGPTGPPPAPGALPAPAGPRPNIVLVVGCTVRRDQVTPYGGVEAATPFLQEMSDRGARFEDAVTASAWTRASMTSIVTGWPFRAVGMAQPAPTPSNRRLAPDATTLAELLRSAGYTTYGATANPNVNTLFGFAQGFDWYSDTAVLWRDGLVKIPGARVVDGALAALDRRTTDQPVYLQLVLLDAHQPGHVGSQEAATYADELAPERVWAYRALLHRFDRSVARLWSGLAARGFDDTNTVLVVVNDHGEGLQWPPEHAIGHGSQLYPSTTGMVWLARGRGIAAGHAIGGLASQIDVVPTVAALAGATGYAGPGRDRASELRGDSANTGSDRAFADTDYQRADRSAIVTPTRGCEINRRTDPPIERCFDRQADPYFRTPLPTVDAGLLAELRAWRAGQDAAAAAWPATGDAAPDAREQEMLESIGYVQGD